MTTVGLQAVNLLAGHLFDQITALTSAGQNL